MPQLPADDALLQNVRGHYRHALMDRGPKAGFNFVLVIEQPVGERPSFYRIADRTLLALRLALDSYIAQGRNGLFLFLGNIRRPNRDQRTLVAMRVRPADDPRSTGPREGGGKYRVTGYDEASQTVISASTTGQGAFSVADVRMGWDPDTAHGSKLEVRHYGEPAKTVTGARLGSGGMCVADPRPNALGKDDNYLSGGHYGVMPWGTPSGAVSSAACHDNGRWSVADPRLPSTTDRMIAIIRALDGTWHRPFTTLELAALQSLIEPEEFLELDGLSDQAWRERIGNAVPPEAAQAIAETMGRTLLLAWTGEKFMLSNLPIWVQPMAVALSVEQPAAMAEG